MSTLHTCILQQLSATTERNKENNNPNDLRNKNAILQKQLNQKKEEIAQLEKKIEAKEKS